MNVKKYKLKPTDIFFIFLVVILIIFIGDVVFANGPQNSSRGQIGKVFATEEADSLFGSVNTEKSINTKAFRLFINDCENYILVNVVDDRFVLLNEEKVVLSETPFNYSQSDTFYVFSIDKVYELLVRGGNSITKFQKRKAIFTISNGSFVLEFSEPCPPKCR
ncbi:MAG: hypothetical protein GXX85_10960 [Ignavibacteria bacterium]|nr:hypothetical protein [Ignavibacteria bacterium]